MGELIIKYYYYFTFFIFLFIIYYYLFDFIIFLLNFNILLLFCYYLFYSKISLKKCLDKRLCNKNCTKIKRNYQLG